MKPCLPVAVSPALLSCNPETYSSTRDSSRVLSAAIVQFKLRPRMRGKLGKPQKVTNNT